jgi:energy-coupling factor transporter ATP-binding protein EcfA2
MDESLFWTQLQQVIRQSDYEAEVAQAQWEQLVRSSAAPTLPTQLIIQTVCSLINHKHPIYFKQRSPLNLPAITPNISFSKKQRLALELSLSNSPITLITGSPGSGKTRIATALANAAVNHQKRVLILTHHSAALTAFHELPGYPFALSHPQNYRNWLIDQLQRQLAQPQMDYLPLHLLPDRELAQLRTRARLETWLPIIQTTSQQQLTELLQQAFPYLCEARTQLFAYRLRQLAPLLWENLNLS